MLLRCYVASISFERTLQYSLFLYIERRGSSVSIHLFQQRLRVGRWHTILSFSQREKVTLFLYNVSFVEDNLTNI